MCFRACTQNLFLAYCRSAVSRSSIARPPPFLGVSSLNLAALRSGHFFARGILAVGCVGPSLMDIKSTSLGPPGRAAKIPRAKSRNLERRSSRERQRTDAARPAASAGFLPPSVRSTTEGGRCRNEVFASSQTRVATDGGVKDYSAAAERFGAARSIAMSIFTIRVRAAVSFSFSASKFGFLAIFSSSR